MIAVHTESEDRTRSYLKEDLPGGQAGRQAKEDEEEGEGQVFVRHVLQLSLAVLSKSTMEN